MNLSCDNITKVLREQGFAKVWIEDSVSSTISGYSDLSVVKIPLSDYELSVVGGTLHDNTLYVVDSDYVETYGQQICSVTMNNQADPTKSYQGIAATKPYVDAVLNPLLRYTKDMIEGLQDKGGSVQVSDMMECLQTLYGCLSSI